MCSTYDPYGYETINLNSKIIKWEIEKAKKDTMARLKKQMVRLKKQKFGSEIY